MKPVSYINTTPLNLHEMFSNVDVGILITCFQTGEILFTNRYFKNITGTREQHIIKELTLRFISDSLEDSANTITIEDLTLGFSSYNLHSSIYIVFFKDISLKLISNQNREDNKFYDKLTSMIAEICNEIGNPLTSVMTTMEVIKENVDHWNIEKSIYYLTQSLNELNRLNSYLRKIRDFTKSREIAIDSVDLKLLINKLWRNNRAKLLEYKIRFACKIENNIIIRTDADIMYQILLNLLYNTLDSIERNGKILITADQSSEHFVKLIYRNSGPPIPEENYRKIFLPFFSTKNSGMGIGLAVSLKYMTRMGGTLKIEKPEPEWGVKFSIHIPIHLD